jgi:hypothetical protein
MIAKPFLGWILYLDAAHRYDPTLGNRKNLDARETAPESPRINGFQPPGLV